MQVTWCQHKVTCTLLHSPMKCSTWSRWIRHSFGSRRHSIQWISAHWRKLHCWSISPSRLKYANIFCVCKCLFLQYVNIVYVLIIILFYLVLHVRQTLKLHTLQDFFDADILMAKPSKFSTNFETAHESDLYKWADHVMSCDQNTYTILYRLVFPVDFEMTSTGIIHGLAFWFEIGFMGTRYVKCNHTLLYVRHCHCYPLLLYSATVWLSTAPHQPPTHWHQVAHCYKSSTKFINAIS